MIKNIYNKFVLGLFLIPSVVYASSEPRRLNGAYLAGIVDKLLGYLFPIAGLLCVVFVIIGGYMWMISGGDPARVKKAQGTLTWALIGLGFILLSVVIIQIVDNFIS